MTDIQQASNWDYEYTPYTATEVDGTQYQIPHFRVFPVDDADHYVAETNDDLPHEVQEAHARLIMASPIMRDALLNIKRLSGKSADHQADPFALLDLIAHEAATAIQLTA